MSVRHRESLGRYLQLIFRRSMGEFKFDSTRMYLGTSWWIIEPLLDLALYYAVFGLFFRRAGADYVPFLLIGLVPWRLFNQLTMNSGGSITNNIHLVRQFPLPKIIYPLIILVKNLYQFSFSLVVLFVMLLLLGIHPDVYWLLLPPVLLSFVLFAVGVSLPLAALVPFLPDIQKGLPHALRILFFFSGVLYTIEELPARFQRPMSFNPLIPLIASWRDVLMYHRQPDWVVLLQINVLSLVLILCGVLLLRRLDGLYAKRVTQ